MLVLLALTGVVAWAKSPVLGLDLKGGLEVVLKAVPNDPKNPPTDEQIDQAISIIRSRVDKLGVSEPEIRKEAGNQVSIALAGIKDPQAAASIIGSTGQLYMLDYTGTLEPIVSKSATGTASYRPTLYALLNAAKNRPNTHPYDGATPEQWYAFDKKTHKRVLNSHRAAVPARRVQEAAAGRPQGQGRRRRPAALARRHHLGRRPDRQHHGQRQRHAAPLRDVPDAERQEHGRVRPRRPRRQVRLRPAERPGRHDGLLLDRDEGVQEHHERARPARAPDAEHRGAVRRHPRQQDRGHADDLVRADAAAASTATRRSPGSRPARPTASRSCCSRARCRSRSTRSRSRRSRRRSARTRCARR